METKKGLAIASFIIVLVCFLAAIISDIAVFSNVILTFIGGIIISGIVFVFLCVMMIASFILIFGIFLVKEYGFWPLHVSIGLFKEILGGIEVTGEQVMVFTTIRIAILVLLVVALILAGIAKHKTEEVPKVPLRGMSVTATVFSIMGIVAAVSLLVLTSFVV